MPIMETKEVPAVRLKDMPAEERERGRAATQEDSAAETARSETLLLLDRKRPTAVMISPRMFSGLSPRGLPHARLPVVRSSRRPNLSPNEALNPRSDISNGCLSDP